MPHTFTVDAVLFDMDGTLIDSTPGVLVAWALFARDYALDARAVAHAAHGRRLHDTLREFCHITDEATLQAEAARFEDNVLQGGVVALPGAVDLIAQIQRGSPDAADAAAAAQRHAWTIVTSATNVYTPHALAKCGVPLPPAGLVTSNDVARGKPHPDPYLAGAQQLGVPPDRCLVVEDAPSGLKAGHAAGAKTLAVCTSHTKQMILDSGSNPDYIVDDLTKVSVKWADGKLEFTIQDE